jgi:hypothetical protein
MIPISIYILLAFLLGAAAAMGGVWLGGLVKQESSLRVENQHQADEIARLHADGLLSNSRIDLLRETIERQEKQIDQGQAREAARGEVVDLGDETGGLLQGKLDDLIGSPPDPGPLSNNLLSQHRRLTEQLSAVANPTPGVPEDSQ